jgi:bacterial leucyl aminopeptidase
MFFPSLAALVLLAVSSLSGAAPISHDELADNAAKGLRLLSLEEGTDPVWKTEKEKLELMRADVHFVGLSSFL